MRLLRSLLFAPGNHPRRVEKALTLDTDAVVLDLEDACPVADKVAARTAVVGALQNPRRASGYVRVNALSTEYGYGDLIAVVQHGVDGIMLTKVNGPDEIKLADWMISQQERERGLPPGSVTCYLSSKAAPASPLRKALGEPPSESGVWPSVRAT